MLSHFLSKQQQNSSDTPSYHSDMDTPWHGTIVHTDQWPSYNGLTAAGYTHLTVNHDIQFVNPLTGVHTNTQEGLWHNVKKNMDGRKSLEMFWTQCATGLGILAGTGTGTGLL